MRGPVKPRAVGPPVAGSLEALVPDDHVSRYPDGRLDLAFVRDRVLDPSPDRGRPSTDPVVFFEPDRVVFEGIRAERQLLALAADRFGVR